MFQGNKTTSIFLERKDMPDKNSDSEVAAQFVGQWREKLVLILLRGAFVFILLAMAIGIPYYLISYDSPFTTGGYKRKAGQNGKMM